MRGNVRSCAKNIEREGRPDLCESNSTSSDVSASVKKIYMIIPSPINLVFTSTSILLGIDFNDIIVLHADADGRVFNLESPSVVIESEVEKARWGQVQAEHFFPFYPDLPHQTELHFELSAGGVEELLELGGRLQLEVQLVLIHPDFDGPDFPRGPLRAVQERGFVRIVVVDGRMLFLDLGNG